MNRDPRPLDRPMEHQPTFLVPLDGSSFGEAILGTVARLAQPLRARVELLLVATPALDPNAPLPLGTGVAAITAGGSPQGAPAPRTSGTDRSTTRLAVEYVLQAYLGRCAEALPGVATTCVVDFADDPAAVIIARARAAHVDLIAMATHGRTGVGHLLAGSVCAAVIRSGVAPVLVLRP